MWGKEEEGGERIRKVREGGIRETTWNGEGNVSRGNQQVINFERLKRNLSQRNQRIANYSR